MTGVGRSGADTGLAVMVAPEGLVTFVAGAAEARADLSDAEAVARACTLTGGASAVVDAVAGLIARQASTEQYVDGMIGSVRAADQPPGGSPWLDDESDSWVVGLVRAATGRMSPTFASRLSEEGPGVLNEVLELRQVFDPVAQAELLLTDGEQFRSNWSRFLRGGVDAVVDTGRAVGDAYAVASPGVGLAYLLRKGRPASADAGAGAGDLARQAATDPDRLVSEVIQWPALRDDPYWWAGYQGAQIAADVATGAAAGTRLGLADDLALAPAGRLGARAAEGIPVPSPRINGLLTGPPARRRPGFGPDGRWAYPDLDRQRLTEPEWLPPGPIRSRRAGPGEHPSSWIDDINHPGLYNPGRSQNCIDCTRAVEANWRGEDAVAAPIRPESSGASLSYLEDWSGGAAELADSPTVEARLQELGPGSSAMVATVWTDNTGHAFSALNVNGEVLWVDGQAGIVAPWPPDYAKVTAEQMAVFVDPAGTPVRPIGVPPSATGEP
ncbi:MAG: toxin glutamine deamidase domain-containing protein [Acidimicrobiales bacterium]